MIITVAFDVKNRVDVMEGWPIKSGNLTFFIERDGTLMRRVCLAFYGVDISHASSFKSSSLTNAYPTLTIGGGIYVQKARSYILNWQAVVSGVQVVDIDYDRYEIRFHPENVDEEKHIDLKSFRPLASDALNAECDFEQIGRAFCVGEIPDDRIESTSHFREGRIATEAGRYVDAYNNMFLFLETRYCDGKTSANQQVDLLLKSEAFCKALKETLSVFAKSRKASYADTSGIFKSGMNLKEQIRAIVLLRGKLRHHSLKSPLRWDPNKQAEHEEASRFLSSVVGAIVIEESLADIYSPEALKKFRAISVSTGFETRINLITHRREPQQALALDMSYPTTVVSSKLCLATVRNAIAACQKEGQLADTVRFEATSSKLGLFSLAFGVWTYTPTRSIETEAPLEKVRCSFEHLHAGTVTQNEFAVPVRDNKLTISDVWSLLHRCFNHIEERDPTTRIMALDLFTLGGTNPIVSYRLGAMVKN